MSDASTPPEPRKLTPEEQIEQLSLRLGIPQIKQQMDDLNQTQNRLLTEIGNTNQNLHSALEWIRDFSSKLNQAQGARQTPQEGQQQPQTPGLMQMVQGGGVSFKDVAEAIRALRGNDQPQQQSEFAQLGQQMVTDLIRATVDDIQQRVYGIRKLPPPALIKESASHALE